MQLKSERVPGFKRHALALAVAGLMTGSMVHAGPGVVTFGGKDYPTYYANSNPLGAPGDTTGFLRKFVDTLPGLNPAGANTFANGSTGEYIPIGVPDKTTYAGSDYYIIGVVEHEQRMHSDLAKATRLRSYVQLYPDSPTGAIPGAQAVPLTYPGPDGKAITWPGTGNQVYAYDKPHYLGPILVATQGVPVRIKTVNLLPPNSPFFLPVDESLGGAGMTETPDVKYSTSRASFHLHGGDNPWISDGTPHQWITAVGDPTLYKKGERLANVPDMPDPGESAQTLFYPNDQSSRLMWYHDHSFGMTRQNAYGGEAAGYLLVDAAELALVNGGVVRGRTIAKALPNTLLDQIPLVIQDKTFVPTDVAKQDAFWDTSKWGQAGDLWFPHVYEPNQIWTVGTDVTTATAEANPAGRWDYAIDANGNYAPTKFDLPSGLGSASTTPEAYMDTPVINGVAYPVLNVEPKAYRVRFLNGSNDRYWNLSLWVADNTVVSSDGRANTEVRMVPAVIPAAGGVPVPAATAPAGGIALPGGIPDPLTAGPNIIQFANEAGLLPRPVVHKAAPAALDVAGNMAAGSLYLGTAERADTVIDFSQYAGKTLILYNDSAVPVPAGDPRYDYYTGNDDQQGTGGAPATLAGFGPNTRTLMQIRIAPTLKSGAVPTPASAYDPKGTGGLLATALPSAYAASADAAVVATTAAAPAGVTAVDFLANTVTLANGTVAPIQIKTIEGYNEPNFGRLIAQLGTEFGTQVAPTPLSYIDKPTDIIPAGTTQYWLIKNNDADNHPMHFHLFNVQVLARVTQTLNPATGLPVIKGPNPNESGWKETVQNWPAEDVIVAVRPKTPKLPFGLPNSVRLMDPTLQLGATTNSALFPSGTTTAPYAFAQLDLNPTITVAGVVSPNPAYGQPLPAGTVAGNSFVNYGWEYVWHCHILGHEENDLMRPLVFQVTPTLPKAPTLVAVDATGKVTWTDPTPTTATTTKGNLANEIGFRVERATVTNGVIGAYQPLPGQSVPNNDVNGINMLAAVTVNTLANATSYQDAPEPNIDYSYRVFTVNQAGQTVSAAASLIQAPLAAPSNLKAAVAGSRVTLTWTDNAFAETGYSLTRTQATIDPVTGVLTWGATPTVVALAANAITYTDRTSVSNAIYRYDLTVVRGAASSAPVTVTPVVTATTLAAPTSPKVAAAVGSLTFSWVPTTTALAAGYEIQRCTGTASACKLTTAVWTPLTTVQGKQTSSYVDSGLASLSNYSYRIRAVNSTETTLTAPWSGVVGGKTL